jgi:hypothetical protein
VQERRKVTRSRVLKGAKIIIGSASTIDCVVRNGIQIANTVDLPETLDLTLDAGSTIRPCRVAWRSVTETGLQFI